MSSTPGSYYSVLIISCSLQKDNMEAMGPNISNFTPTYMPTPKAVGHQQPTQTSRCDIPPPTRVTMATGIQIKAICWRPFGCKLHKSLTRVAAIGRLRDLIS